MKNTILTLFVLLLVGMTNSNATAQDYDPQWVDQVGPNNITIVSEYSNLPAGLKYRRVSRNGAPYYAPIWQPIQETVINGTSGDDTIRVYGSSNPAGYGYGFKVQILDANYVEILTEVIAMTGIDPFPVPDIVIDDIVYGVPPEISFRADVYSEYGPGREGYYVTKLYNKIWRTSSPGYSHTAEWTFPIGIVPFGYHNLPFNFYGDYCFVWWVEDEDTSIDSHFGPQEVWRSDTLCFSLGTTGIQGLQNVSGDGSLASFPNPFQDLVNVVSSSISMKTYTVADLSGKVVASGTLAGGINTIDLAGLSTGVYILTGVSADGQRSSIRLTKEG